MPTTLNSKILGEDPARWPILTNIYRYISPGNIIYTACRYENVPSEYMLERSESSHHCYHCATNVDGGYAIAMYTRVDQVTIPMIVCVGCVDRVHFRDGNEAVTLKWYDEGISPIMDRITTTDKKSDKLLAVLHEIHNCMQLRDYKLSRYAIMPEKFTRLMNGARKL